MDVATRRKREAVLRARKEEELKRAGLIKDPEPVTILKKHVSVA